MTFNTISPEIWLGLAKVTALLLIGLALNLAIKTPRLRVIILGSILVSILPLFFLASEHFFSLLKVIPKEQIAPITETPAPSAPTILPTEVEPTTAPVFTSPLPEVAFEATPETANTTPPSPEISAQPEPARPILPWVYAIGLIACLLPLLLSKLQLLRLSKKPAHGLPLEIWENLQKDSKRPAFLSFISSPSAPFSTGILSPAVLLPHDSVNWTRSRINSTLLHEDAHHQHRDPLIRTLCTIIRAVFWFHPLVWLAHRQLIEAQEQLCDQYAVARGIEPEDYAEDLLAAASHSHLTPSEALSMARWSQIGNRIRYVLDPRMLKAVTAGQTRALMGLMMIATLFLITLGFAAEKEEEPVPEVIVEEKAELIGIIDGVAKIHAPKNAKQKEIIAIMTELEAKGITKVNFVKKGYKLPKKGESSDTRGAIEKLLGHPHERTAVVQVHPSMLRLTSEQPGALLTRNYMESEFETIVATETLMAALQHLKGQLKIDSADKALRFLKNQFSPSLAGEPISSKSPLAIKIQIPPAPSLTQSPNPTSHDALLPKKRVPPKPSRP